MTELPENVVAFNALASRVMGALYEAFPTPTDLQAIRFFPKDPEALIDTGAPNTSFDLFEDTVRFLRDEGYIRVVGLPGMQSYNPTFQMCRLTEKGLSTLGRPLPSLENKDGKTSIGGKIIATAKQGALKGVGGLAMEASKLELSHLFTLITG